MSLNHLLPFASTLIMGAFTVFVLQRFLVRRKLYFLFWGLGLAMFGIGSFAEAYLALAWNRWVFFAWYYFGAVLNAGWIGHGTVYLLFRKRWVHWLTVVLIVGSLVALVLMLQVMPRLDETQFTTGKVISEQYQEIMPSVKEGATVRWTTPFFNVYGLITLVGGALWSAYLFWRKRILPNRVVGNVLIAAGALSIASASTLTRLGYGSLLYLGELVAAVLMFAGFLVAARPETEERVAPAVHAVD
ncbi:MAG: hypothetical protein L0332_06580 [Chloroflexi bacterium]|nr:hypothetical protein [Chloroflexota bacterium]MCI0575844.1 hypothetical protein [Chloroflexota bacterium]MCI0646571.1 hypothetical protein [Chloroflexota bacterium]MCI0726373.1 hypothetical protein [Chloroflexota bacterium]